MTTPDERKEEISDYVNNLLKEDKLALDGAVDFNSFELKDQQAILDIYRIKANQGELKALIDDKVAGIEEVAKLYRAQKCAFQDVLTKQGFDATSEVPKDYEGRIAILTNHGTLIILGKSKRKGRLVTMSRIHSPHLNYDHYRGEVQKDLELWKSPTIDIYPFKGYKGSPARALAINPHGSDDDELEEYEANDTVFRMGLETAIFLIRPRTLEDVENK